MKSTIKLGSVKIGEMEINNIEFSQEYSVTESIRLMRAGKEFAKEMIAELPEMMMGLDKAQHTMESLDRKNSVERNMEEAMSDLCQIAKNRCRKSMVAEPNEIPADAIKVEVGPGESIADAILRTIAKRI